MTQPTTTLIASTTSANKVTHSPTGARDNNEDSKLPQQQQPNERIARTNSSLESDRCAQHMANRGAARRCPHQLRLCDTACDVAAAAAADVATNKKRQPQTGSKQANGEPIAAYVVRNCVHELHCAATGPACVRQHKCEQLQCGKRLNRNYNNSSNMTQQYNCAATHLSALKLVILMASATCLLGNIAYCAPVKAANANKPSEHHSSEHSQEQQQHQEESQQHQSSEQQREQQQQQQRHRQITHTQRGPHASERAHEFAQLLDEFDRYVSATNDEPSRLAATTTFNDDNQASIIRLLASAVAARRLAALNEQNNLVNNINNNRHVQQSYDDDAATDALLMLLLATRDAQRDAPSSQLAATSAASTNR